MTVARRRDWIWIRTRTPRERRMAIIAEVAECHGLAVDDMTGTARTRDIVAARWEAMARIRTEFGDTLPMIGRLFNRDHTTVVHGLKRYEEMQRHG